MATARPRLIQNRHAYYENLVVSVHVSLQNIIFNNLFFREPLQSYIIVFIIGHLQELQTSNGHITIKANMKGTYIERLFNSDFD